MNRISAKAFGPSALLAGAVFGTLFLNRGWGRQAGMVAPPAAVPGVAPNTLIALFALLLLILVFAAGRHARLKTRLEQMKRTLAARSAVNQLIASESRNEPLLQGTCEALVQSEMCEGAWLVHTKDVGVDVFHTAMGRAFERLAALMSLGDMPPCAKRALDTPSVSIVESTDLLCLDCECGVRRHQRSLSVRIEHRDHVFGVLTALVPAGDAHSRHQHEILLDVAANLGAALSTIRMRLQQEILQGKYQAAMASAPEAVIAFEWDGRITAWNAGAEALFGYTLAHMRGRSVETIIPDEDLEQHRTLCLEVEREKSLSGVETRRLTSDGKTIPVEMSLSQATTRTGRAEGFVAVLRDISERKRTETIQRQQLNMIRELADASSDEQLFSICLTSAVELADMNFGAVYRRAPETGELRLAVAQGMADSTRSRIARFSPESSVSTMIGQGLAVYPCREESPPSTPVGDGDEETEHALLGFVPIQHRETVVAALCIGTTRPETVRPDIPAILEMIAEELSAAYTRLQLAEQLHESENRFSRLLESVDTVAVQGYAPDGTVHYWNRASERLYGYSADEAIGRDIVELTVPPETQSSARELISRAGESGQTRPAVEVMRVRKDGQTVPVYSSRAAVQTPNGMELYCMDVDLAPIRELEEQLRQAQKMESVGQLAGGIAHDFNNLLQVINGSAELAVEAVAPDSELHEEIEEISKAGKRAAQLVNQLLLFSRRQIMQPADIDLNEVVGKLIKMLGRLLGEHIQLEFRPANSLPRINADRGMIEQLIMNLAVNARDAMPNGGQLTIGTQPIQIDQEFRTQNPWAETGSYVMLSIADTGSGMSEETLDHLFEPFYTTKEVGKGTGLGLATAHGIIKQHNGQVHVTSELGTGTTFNIYLPVNKTKARVDDSAAPAQAPGGSETVLLAEDDQGVARLATKVLERAGYTVTRAEDGMTALRLLEEDGAHYDLLILDVVMPQCGGYEVYRELQRQGCQIPILFATGYSEEAIHSNFIVENGLTLVQKPFAPALLLRSVRDVLDNGQRSS